MTRRKSKVRPGVRRAPAIRGGCGTGIHDDPSRDMRESVDELPQPIRTVSPTKTVLQSVEEGDTTGETVRPAQTPDGRPVAVRGVVHDRLTPYLQLRKAQCAKYPCAACGNPRFVRVGSDEWKEINDYLQGQVQKSLEKGGFGIWPGMTASAFVMCDDDPLRPLLNDDGEPVFEKDGRQLMMGGPGAKWLGYNCPAWRERTAEFLPHWLPSSVVNLVDHLVRVSTRMRIGGIDRFLRRLRGEKVES